MLTLGAPSTSPVVVMTKSEYFAQWMPRLILLSISVVAYVTVLGVLLALPIIRRLDAILQRLTP